MSGPYGGVVFLSAFKTRVPGFRAVLFLEKACSSRLSLPLLPAERTRSRRAFHSRDWRSAVSRGAKPVCSRVGVESDWRRCCSLLRFYAWCARPLLADDPFTENASCPLLCVLMLRQEGWAIDTMPLTGRAVGKQRGLRSPEPECRAFPPPKKHDPSSNCQQLDLKLTAMAR